MLRNLNLSSNGRRDSSDGRVGVLASEIPTGYPLPPFLLNDVDGAAPDRFYKLDILTSPSAGKLHLDKRSVGSFIGASPGTYRGTMRVRKYDPGVGLVYSAEGNYDLTIGNAPPPTATRIMITVVDGNDEIGANLSGLHWAVFADPDTAEITAPIAQGDNGSTNNVGEMVLDIAAAGLPLGQQVRLIFDLGTKGFNGVVEVS